MGQTIVGLSFLRGGEKSFVSCWISVSTDGSEDHEIHCVKENGVVVRAKPDIEQATANLLAQNPVTDGGERNPILLPTWNSGAKTRTSLTPTKFS